MADKPDLKRNDRGLTAQQEAFAQALAGGMNQAEAYRTAYPASSKWKESALYSEASRTARAPLIAARVKEIREPAVARVRERIVYTADVAMDEAMQALELALETRQPGAMVAAIQLRAKLNGLITDKKEVAVTQMGAMTPSEKAFALEQLRSELAKRQVQLPDAGVSDVDPK